MLERPCTCGTKCLIVSLLFSPLKLINNERHKKSLVPPFLTIHIMPYYSLCKMAIFATSQIRAIFFLPIKCFLNQFFSHQTILMRFLLICVFSSQVYIFQLFHLTQKKEKKRQIVWQEIVLFVFFVLFFFLFLFFSNCAR